MVESALGVLEELVEGALLDYLALVEHIDPIGFGNCLDLVGNHDDEGDIEFVDGLLDLLLVCSVEG